MSDVLTDLAMAGYGTGSSGQYALSVGKKWATICCVFHTEDTPSLGINLDGTGYNCFGCGAKGHYSELRKQLLPEIYDKGSGLGAVISKQTSLTRSMNAFNNAVDSSAKAALLSEKINNINQFEANTSIMVPWEEDWRGLTGEFLRMFGAKYWISTEISKVSEEFIQVPRILFPFKHPRLNFTIGYAARRLDDVLHKAEAKYRNASVIPTQEVLYLYSAIQPGSPVVIVEGPLDALVLRAHGIPAVASLGTNQWSAFKTRLILSRRPCMVMGLGDGDLAGRKFNNVLFNTFRHLVGKKYFQVDLPEGLDPGGFDQAWIDYIYQGVDNASGGYLTRQKEAGQHLLTHFDPTLIRAS